MIEIRELIIRATVEDESGQNRTTNPRMNDNGKKGCCEENLDLMLKIIKEKKER